MAYAAIPKPSLYMNTTLYTGTGAIQAITGVEFQPDLNWTKCRTATQSHVVTDAVRGVTETLYTNATQAETTEANGLTAFGADGFTVGTSDMWSDNTETFVSWNWKANGAGSLNEVGSLDSTVSVNTTAGFSIVKWTNGTSSVQTIGHGLGAVPKMIIMKVTGATGGWNTYHTSIGNTHGLYLNSTAASEDNDAFWNDTSPTSTVFTTGTNGNLINNTLVAYCFADVKGYSRFSSYVGNGSANGTFVYTGFKPAYVMVKNTGATESWHIVDNKINPFNPMDTNLFPNIPGAEGTSSSYEIDMVSNGFKVRTTDSTFNTDDSTYIYAAFGQPIISNSGVCATAR